MSNKEMGNKAETAVHEYLIRLGLRPVCKNYSSHNCGEIDLIFVKGPRLYFVEVKSRCEDNPFGGAKEALTRGKRRRIEATARRFLANPAWNGYDAVFLFAAVIHRQDHSIHSIEILPI